MHCHWVPPEPAQTLRERRQPPYITRGGIGEQLVLPDETLSYSPAYENLDLRREQAVAHGIIRQVISLPSLFGIDALPISDAAPMISAFNTGLSAQVAHAPDHYAGLAALPLADMSAALRELDRAAALGLSGIILPDAGFQTAEKADAFTPLLAQAQAHGLCVFVHPGNLPQQADAPPLPGREPDNANQRHISLSVQARLGQAMTTFLMTDLLDRFPRLNVFVANLGGTLPFVLERMITVAETRGLPVPDPLRFDGRLAVDTASFGPNALSLAIQTFGARNVIFGTDDPVFAARVVLDGLDALSLTTAERDAILYGNALRFLGG